MKKRGKSQNDKKKFEKPVSLHPSSSCCHPTVHLPSTSQHKSAPALLMNKELKDIDQLLDFLTLGGGGGTPHMKGVGMLVGNFELNP